MRISQTVFELQSGQGFVADRLRDANGKTICLLHPLEVGGGGGGGGRGQNKGYSMGFLFVCSLHHFDNTCTKFNKSSAERGDINPFGFIV